MIAIQSFSRTWGGSGFIIIPTDGITISKTFWPILLAYDPDYLWVSHITGDGYERGIKLSDDLVNQIKLRLAPFHYSDAGLSEEDKKYGRLQNLIIEDTARPGYKADFPFTDLASILPNCNHPKKIADLTAFKDVPPVWAAACTGLVTEAFEKELAEIGISRIPVDYAERPNQYFDLVLGGVQGSLADGEIPFPFAFSSLNLGFYRSLEFHDWNEATVVVIGDSLEDFCLYYSLSRMRKKVAWLLPGWIPQSGDEDSWYQEDSFKYFSRSLRDLQDKGQQNGAVYFMSCSINGEKLESTRELFRTSPLDINVAPNSLPSEAQPDGSQHPYYDLSQSLEYLLKFPTRLFEYENVDRITSLHLVGSEVAGFFNTAKPKNFTRITPNHRWITDFSIVNQQFPRHPILGKEIVRDPVMFERHARVGRDGVAFTDPHTGFISGDFESWLRKPTIRLPAALEIFELLFRKMGYRTEISDKGRFALYTMSKFGGLGPTANYFLTEKGKIFDEYFVRMRTKGNEQDLAERGLLLASDRRRYLDFAAIKEVVGVDVTASTLIYDLISKSIFHRGLILRCEFCRGTDWYDLTQLSSQFQCKRCGQTQIHGLFHSLGRAEPLWYYKLDEVVYRAIEHNFIVPFLATYRLATESKSFDYVPELELRNERTGEPYAELDVCCIPDGKLTIGEAKIGNRLASSKKEENKIISKYFELAEAIGASQVVFATSSEAWDEKTIKRITDRFADSLTKVIIWTRNDLFHR